MDFRHSKFAALLLLLIATLSLAGCLGAAREQRLAVSAVNVKELPKETIIGITTVKGDDVEFDAVPYPSGNSNGKKGGFFEDGTVHGVVKGSEYSLPLDQVQRIWVMRRNVSTGRTVALVGVLAVPAAVAIAVVVAANDKPKPLPPPTGGCPFVYSWDGHEYVFDAELYGGAVARGLQREDYSELPIFRRTTAPIVCWSTMSSPRPITPIGWNCWPWITAPGPAWVSTTRASSTR